MTRYIGITGTHSTGKSTLVESLRCLAQERGIRVAAIDDKAAACMQQGFPIMKAHTFESTLWMMVTVVQQELERGLDADLVIVDRPVFDAIGYLEAALESTGRTITAEQRDYLYSMARLHSPRYDLLLKTQLDESIPLGPGRGRDLQFRREAEAQIGGVLEKLRLSFLDPLAEEAKFRIAGLLGSIAPRRRGARSGSGTS